MELRPDAPIRLLLVEDDEESGAALVNMLRKRGVDTVMEQDAALAMRRLETEEFDVVVADIRLDGMSGVELLGAIRQKAGGFPVILLTGYDSLESAIQAVRLGAQDYILKPLESIDDLLRPVRKAVKAHRLMLRNVALEAELRESERRFRSVLEHSVDIICRIDIRGRRIDYISPSVTAALGYSQEQVLAMDSDALLDIVHPEDRERVIAAACALATEGDGEHAIQTLECRVCGEDGEYRWLSVTHSLMDGDDGKPVAVVGNARDISMVKENEIAERELGEKLARVKRLESMSLVAGGIAHDLNNALLPVVGLPDMLLAQLTPDGRFLNALEARDDIESIKYSAKAAAAIIGNLLSLSRGERCEFRQVSIRDVVTGHMQTAGFKALAAGNAGVAIVDRLRVVVPKINGSVAHLSQAVMNLVTNAFQAMPGGGRLTLEVRHVLVADRVVGYEVIPEGDYVVLRVADTGCGIRKTDMDRLFEPFFSRKNMEDGAGTGLGLLVVHGVVKDHKGFIDVRSREGEGTEFLLYLPAAKVPSNRKEGGGNGTVRTGYVDSVVAG